MENLSDVKASMLQFFEALEAAEAEIPAYRERAQKLADHSERRDAISGRIARLQDERIPLESELASIKPAYLDALYEMNEPLQQQLQARKTELEELLRASEEAEQGERSKLEPIDQGELAKLRAELDSFKVPDVFAFVNDLDVPLQRAANALEDEVSSIRLPAGMDEETYKATRMALDPSYRYHHQEAERLRRTTRQPSRYVFAGDSSSSFLEANGLVTGERSDRRISSSVRDSRLSDELE